MKTTFYSDLVTQSAHYSYSGYVETTSGWVLWEKKTSTGGSRSPAVVTSEGSPAECPVIWRQWPSDNVTLGTTISLTRSLCPHKVSGLPACSPLRAPMWRVTPSITTRAPWPRLKHTISILTLLWILEGPQIKTILNDTDILLRTYRVTKVAVLGGDDVIRNPLLNLDIRVGEINKANADANTKFTENKR